MADGLADGHASVGVELQRPLQEVIHLGSDELEQFAERPARDHPKGLNVVLGALIADEVDVSGGADGAEDDGAAQEGTYSWSQTECGKSLIFLQFMSEDLGGESGQQALPGKSGFRSVKTLVMVMSSPRMHPTDQMSIALLYFLSSRMSQGARYHLVATCAVNLTAGFSLLTTSFSCFSSSQLFISLSSSFSWQTALASPKSQSLTWLRSSVMSMFSGLRSRCRTWHCWQQLIPSNIWKMISLILRQSKMLLDLKSFLASVGRQSSTSDSSLHRQSSTSISLRLMMLGCFNFLKSSISRRILSDSYLLSRKFFIFFMATRSPVWRWMAEKTMEDTPQPILLEIWYLPFSTCTPYFGFSLSCFYFNFSIAALRSFGFSIKVYTRVIHEQNVNFAAQTTAASGWAESSRQEGSLTNPRANSTSYRIKLSSINESPYMLITMLSIGWDVMVVCLSISLLLYRQMDSFGSKSKIGKRFSANDTPEEKMENIKLELNELTKSLGTKKAKDQEKGFVFSLSHFEEKTRDSRGSKNEPAEPTQITESEKRTSLDKNEQSRRKMIYGNESYKEKYEEDFPTSVEANNDLFSMVFLSKAKKPDNNASLPASFTKAKSSTKIEQQAEEAGIGVKDFELGRKLGAGKFGEVYLARHRSTGFMCALKKIDKSNVDSKLIVQLVREIKIQSFLNHPNVVKMYTFFADKNYIYLALELCFSGQLYNFLKKKRKVPEDMARFLVQQICRALDYMHSNQIIHRDLKPENVIYHCGLMKICDFGWSISTNTMRGTFCGTPLYVSPELLKRKTYNNKIDVWSVGILTYELLFGRVPFEITTEQDFMKIVQDEIKFSKATKVSDDAKDFILICLEKDPRDRYTIPELLEHPFLTQQENVPLAELY